MNIDQFEKFITRGMAAQAAVDKITGRQPDELARLRAINEGLINAVDLLIGEIDQCCDVTDAPTNEAIRVARAALAKAKEQK